MDLILSWKNAAAVSLASFETSRSENAAENPRPPRFQRASYSRSRSSGVAASADVSFDATTKPTRDSRAGEVDAFVRPLAGVVPLAAECLEPLEPGCLRRGQAAGRHDAEPGR